MMEAAHAFETLLDLLRQTHDSAPALQRFCAFPTDLIRQAYRPQSIPAAKLFAQDEALAVSPFGPLTQALQAAGPHAFWRETYKNTMIGENFLNRFGCYAIIGPDAPWTSKQMLAFVVYMPPGLWYPFHAHPAEELYFVLAGSAEFLTPEDSRQTTAGDVVFHASNQPHATRTATEPLLALVLWRNHLDIPPQLCPGWENDRP